MEATPVYWIVLVSTSEDRVGHCLPTAFSFTYLGHNDLIVISY